MTRPTWRTQLVANLGLLMAALAMVVAYLMREIEP